MMNPALLLGTLLSIGYASLFHIWGGRTVRELWIFMAAAGIGFAFGQFVGIFTHLPPLQIGQIHTMEATFGSWLALLVTRLAVAE